MRDRKETKKDRDGEICYKNIKCTFPNVKKILNTKF